MSGSTASVVGSSQTPRMGWGSGVGKKEVLNPASGDVVICGNSDEHPFHGKLVLIDVSGLGHKASKQGIDTRHTIFATQPMHRHMQPLALLSVVVLQSAPTKIQMHSPGKALGAWARRGCAGGSVCGKAASGQCRLRRM